MDRDQDECFSASDEASLATGGDCDDCCCGVLFMGTGARCKAL